MSEIGITYRFKEYDEYEEYCVKKPCKIKKLNDGQKNEYTLTELSLFRLCPKLFFLRGRSECSFYVSEKALAMYYIAVVRIASLSEFASDNYNKKIVYKVEKSDYIDSIKEIVEKNVKKYAPFFSFMDEKEREIVEDAVLKKVVNYVDDAKNFAKSNRFTVIPYGDTEYDCEGYRLIIHHICRVVDYDKKVWRARENEIDLDIVTANSVEKSFRNAHYWQITEELHENKPTINRVKLVSQIVTKIGVQYENKRYFVDGVERTNELVELVRNCDFSTERQMKSDFCPYCMMKDIC